MQEDATTVHTNTNDNKVEVNHKQSSSVNW